MDLQVGKWAVCRGSGNYFRLVRIDALTPKLIKTRSFSGRFQQEPRHTAIGVFDTQEAARAFENAIDEARQPFRLEWRAEIDRHAAVRADIAKRQDEAIAAVIAQEDAL